MNTLRTFLASLKLGRGSGRGFGASPEADWKIIFSITATFVVIVIALSAFIFIQIDKGEIFVVERPEDGDEHMLDIEALREAAEYYQGKALEFDRIRIERASVIDPSL